VFVSRIFSNRDSLNADFPLRLGPAQRGCANRDTVPIATLSMNVGANGLLHTLHKENKIFSDTGNSKRRFYTTFGPDFQE
jgi:hypothetical protein